MKVIDAMTKNVIKIKPSTGIREIYEIFRDKNIKGLPVVDKDDKVLGLITKAELLDALIPDYFDMVSDFLFIDDFGALEDVLEGLPALGIFVAEDLLNGNVITVKETASLMKAPVLMNKYNVTKIPVVNKENKIVGIITRMDVCKALFNGVTHD